MAGAATREKIDLRILSPSSELRNGITLTDLPVTLTIRELRIRLQTAIASHPAAAAQRLIYRGRALVQESATLLDVFGPAAIQEDALHTIHLVLAERPNTPATSTPASQQPSNTPSNPFVPVSSPPGPGLPGQANNPLRPSSTGPNRQAPQVVLLGPNGVSMPLPANGMPGGSHADIMTAIANQQAQQMQNAAHQRALAAMPTVPGIAGNPPPELAGLPPFVQQQIQAAQAQVQAMHQNLLAQQAAHGQAPASASATAEQQPPRSPAATPRPPGLAPGPGPSPFQQFITQQQQERAAAGMQGINSTSELQREAALRDAPEALGMSTTSEAPNQAPTRPQAATSNTPTSQTPENSHIGPAPANHGQQPGQPHFHPHQQRTFTITSHNFDPSQLGAQGFPAGFQPPLFQAFGQPHPQFMMPSGQTPVGMHINAAGNRGAPLPQPMMFHRPDQIPQGVAFAAHPTIGAVMGRFGALQVSVNNIDPLVQLLGAEARRRPLTRQEIDGLQSRHRTLQQEFDSTRAMAQQIMQNAPRDPITAGTLVHIQALEASLTTRLERLQASLADIERGSVTETDANNSAGPAATQVAAGSAPALTQLTQVAIGNAAEDATNLASGAGPTTHIEGNIMSEVTIAPTPTMYSATQPVPSQPTPQPAAATIPRDPTQTNVFLVNDPQGQSSALIVGPNTTHTTSSLPPQIVSALLASRLPIPQLTSVFNDVMRESLQPGGFLSHNRQGRLNPYQYNYRQSTRSRTARTGQPATVQTDQERRQADYEWAIQRVAARQGRLQGLDGSIREQEAAITAQAARVDDTIARAREVLRRHNVDIPEPYDPENDPNFTGEAANNAAAQPAGNAVVPIVAGPDINHLNLQRPIRQQEDVAQNLGGGVPDPHQQLQNLQQQQHALAQQLAGRQPDEMRDILAPIVRNLWLIIRIVGVVWFFASGGRGYLQATGLGISIVIVYAIQNGYIALPREWIEGARNWWRDLLDPAHVANALNGGRIQVQGQAQGQAQVQAQGQGQSPAAPTPEDTARRLLLQRQRQGWLSNRSREYIRSAVLLVASLIPGLGEDYVRQVEERLRREREEIERLQREAEEAAAGRIEDQQEQLQIAEATDADVDAHADAGTSIEQRVSDDVAWSTLESEVSTDVASSSAVEAGASEGLTRVNKGKGRADEAETTVDGGVDEQVAASGSKTQDES